jgi:hypothetical protein
MKVCINTEWTTEDVFVRQGPLIEPAFPIHEIVENCAEGTIFCIPTGQCSHEVDLQAPGELGFPAFREDFFFIRNTPLGKELYREWRQGTTITNTLAARDLLPSGLRPEAIKVLPDPDEQPQVNWGRA